MAKMSESVVVIKVTQLLKDDIDEMNVFDSEAVIEQLEALLEELVGKPKAMIEIIRA